MAHNPYPHYAWAFGHFVVLFSTLLYLKSYVTFKSSAHPWYYKSAFTGTITSYAIVCFKSLGTPQPNAAWVQRALADENVQYFIMAVIWWFSKPVPIALLPYAVFSLFHILTFTRTNIVPLIIKPAPAPAAQGANGAAPAAQQPALSKAIGQWVRANYDTAMIIVARLELVILARVVLGVFVRQNSLLVPLFYVHFLRARYYFNSFTRDSVHAVVARVDAFADKEGQHPQVKNVWSQAKNLVGRWAGAGGLAPQQAPPAAAAAAGARQQ